MPRRTRAITCAPAGRCAATAPVCLMSAGSLLLEMRGIERSFGGVQALRGVDFDLKAGEVHALLGENGAGKSTLMNVLSGVLPPDKGEIRVSGELVHFASPRE